MWNLCAISLFPFLFLIAQGQFFDPNQDDKSYLDNIERDLKTEVDDAKHELMGQARVIEDITKTFIGAKLKENLFKALRFLAENEIEQIKEKEKTIEKQSRQSGKQEDSEGEAEDGEVKTTQSSVAASGATTSGVSGLVPRVANIIKTLFGGRDQVNLTSYVEAATKYLPESVGNQIVGVVKLLAQSPTATASRRSTTLIPTILVYPTTEQIKETSTERPIVPKVTAKPTNRTEGEDGEEEEEIDGEDGSSSRQLRLPDLSGGLSILGALLGGSSESRTTTGKPGQRQPKTTTEGPGGFDEETTSNSVNLANFANDVRNGFGDLIKVVPDLFKGAREGVTLLTALRELFGSFGGSR